MNSFILPLRGIDDTKKQLAGSKASNLAELFRIKETRVPDGFCVTTEAFRQVTRDNQAFELLLDELRQLSVGDIQEIRETCARMRLTIQHSPVPDKLAGEVANYLSGFSANDSFAVRSSATAEDLPAASFAGQQDTWLNVIGKDAVLHHICKCWASLFTDRAVIYRMKNGFDHRNVLLAVIVQRMIPSEASGVAFTADPVTGNRKVLAVDACFGLGDALMSGRATADNYKVDNGIITSRTIAASPRQVLNDDHILLLERICRTIETHFGVPQDIEWCFWKGDFYIVQSRPITTLYPIPESGGKGNCVYVSVGHQQMMTGALKPLGLSVWQMIAFRPMHKAGGRLFVDITQSLTLPASRYAILKAMGQHDPLILDALTTIIVRGDFIQATPEDASRLPLENQANPTAGHAGNSSSWTFEPKVDNDPAAVAGLIAAGQAAIAALRGSIQTKSGTDLFDFIQKDILRLKETLVESRILAVITTVVEATNWLNEKMADWLGERNAADAISQSVANNVTAGMGLALLEVADVIRPYPEVIAFLERPDAGDFFTGLSGLQGGRPALEAIATFLDQYGVRCAGEIDITATRWFERPAMLAPAILNHIRSFKPGTAKEKFEDGLRRAITAELSLLDRLRRLPDGEQKALETRKVISVIRNFIGYREYPKYQIVNHLYLYRMAMLKEAARLLQHGVIRDIGDVYYLTFDEFRETVRSNQADHGLIAGRRSEQATFERMTPPRVITSDGEIIHGKYQTDNLPAGALPGLAVSSGIAEGRARVVLEMEDAGLEAGDILVTTFTDPGWTPLFVSVKGLITEVGGLMTHGAVIAREYGLPAVVGVEDATRKIKDGQRIRINGTAGYVELLDADE